MNNEKNPPEFWARADEIIAVANKQCADENLGKVSSSLLYAAARFNSFNVATSSENVEDMKKDRESAIKYFTDQYQKMLTNNIDDYIENFDKYRS